MYVYILIPLSSYLLITPLISNFASTVACPSLNTVLTLPPVSLLSFYMCAPISASTCLYSCFKVPLPLRPS